MKTIVDAEITVTVRHKVKLAEGETVEDFKNRLADVYLHGTGEYGSSDKSDLGGETKIKVLEVIEEED
jgi:hypothetical protein